MGSIRRTSESRRLDACSLARRSRQSEVAAEGGEEADGATTSKQTTEGERLDTGNAWVIRAGKEKVTMSNKRASPASDQPIVPRPPRIGDRIRITKDIDWDGEDCHPPCTLAYKGDLMHVRRIRGYNVMACHNLLDESTMLVQQGEYEIVNE